MSTALRRVCLLIAFTAAAALPGAQAPANGQAPQGSEGRGEMGQGGRGRGGIIGGRGPGRGTQPTRDQNRPVETGTATIAGRVIAADSGRPIKRARVVVAGSGRPRAATTDEQGRYRIAALPPGSYSITAARTGFVDASYGQRRALHSGTPLQIADRQQVTDADIRLPRGGVVTGHVFDEDGDPLARALVTVLRYQYVAGEKRLSAAGGDQSDDRGQYRIFGLPPGEYFVSATAGGLDRIVNRFLNTGGEPDAAIDSTGYAPTYYPGVSTVSDAMRVKLATAQELTGIDFQLQLVPLATVHGTVAGSTSMAVVLVPDEGGIGARAGQNFRGRVMQDGTFSIPGVPPGRYMAMARGDGLAATQAITVSGQDVMVSLTPVAGTELAGTITLEAAGANLPKGFTGFRIAPMPLDSPLAAGRFVRSIDIGESGTFTIKGLMAGRYAIRATGPRGWMMKAAYLNGHDVTDQPLEIGNENLSDLNVIFTDKISGIAGTVRDSHGAGVANTTVIVFATDPKLWIPQSRLIQTTRTDQNGAYAISSLPPGDYFVLATDDVEQGEWFDPAFLDQAKDNAVTVTVGEREQRTADLKAS